VIVTATDKYFQDGVYISHSYHEAVFLPLEPENGGGTDDPINDRVFADLTSSDWAYPYFNALYNQGYISGYEEDGQVYMKPYNTATRSETSVTLVRAWHQDPEYIPVEPLVEEIYFVDLKPDTELNSMSAADPAPAALAWNVKWDEENYDLGITSGCSANPPRYCGEASTTRAQAATFFVKTLYAEDFKPPEIGSSSFQDVPMLNADGSSAWEPKWIEQALQDGIIQDCNTDMQSMLFRPDDAATRSELMCMLYHTLEAKGALE